MGKDGSGTQKSSDEATAAHETNGEADETPRAAGAACEVPEFPENVRHQKKSNSCILIPKQLQPDQHATHEMDVIYVYSIISEVPIPQKGTASGTACPSYIHTRFLTKGCQRIVARACCVEENRRNRRSFLRVVWGGGGFGGKGPRPLFGFMHHLPRRKTSKL